MSGGSILIPAPESPIKAWVNFDGSGTVSIRESFNVSSITDNGIGNYTVNFAEALEDANYAVASTIGDNASSTMRNGVVWSTDMAAGSCVIRTIDGSSYNDLNHISAVFVR